MQEQRTGEGRHETRQTESPCYRHPPGWLTPQGKCYVCWCESEISRLRAGLTEREALRDELLSQALAEIERLRHWIDSEGRKGPSNQTVDALLAERGYA